MNLLLPVALYLLRRRKKSSLSGPLGTPVYRAVRKKLELMWTAPPKPSQTMFLKQASYDYLMEGVAEMLPGTGYEEIQKTLTRMKIYPFSGDVRDLKQRMRLMGIGG